jgi:hypothetical protein
MDTMWTVTVVTSCPFDRLVGSEITLRLQPGIRRAMGKVFIEAIRPNACNYLVDVILDVLVRLTYTKGPVYLSFSEV